MWRMRRPGIPTTPFDFAAVIAKLCAHRNGMQLDLRMSTCKMKKKHEKNVEAARAHGQNQHPLLYVKFGNSGRKACTKFLMELPTGRVHVVFGHVSLHYAQKQNLPSPNQCMQWLEQVTPLFLSPLSICQELWAHMTAHPPIPSFPTRFQTPEPKVCIVLHICMCVFAEHILHLLIYTQPSKQVKKSTPPMIKQLCTQLFPPHSCLVFAIMLQFS